VRWPGRQATPAPCRPSGRPWPPAQYRSGRGAQRHRTLVGQLGVHHHGPARRPQPVTGRGEQEIAGSTTSTSWIDTCSPSRRRRATSRPPGQLGRGRGSRCSPGRLVAPRPTTNSAAGPHVPSGSATGVPARRPGRDRMRTGRPPGAGYGRTARRAPDRGRPASVARSQAADPAAGRGRFCVRCGPLLPPCARSSARAGTGDGRPQPFGSHSTPTDQRNPVADNAVSRAATSRVHADARGDGRARRPGPTPRRARAGGCPPDPGRPRFERYSVASGAAARVRGIRALLCRIAGRSG